MIDEDPDFIKYVRKYKENKGIGRKRDAKILKKEDEASDNLMQKFGIKDTELDNIFDLIAQEHPDL
jgi:hypothetical protein